MADRFVIAYVLYDHATDQVILGHGGKPRYWFNERAARFEANRANGGLQ